jgi:hypothetical protein
VLVLRSESFEVQSRLAQFGLLEEELTDAVARGAIRRRECTPNHPASFAGLEAWGWTVCYLRDALVPKGWTRREEGNWPVTVHPNRRMVIAVATGDENTGSLVATPMTKSPKGPNTVQAIAVNQAQISLFPDSLPDQTGDEEDRLTWLLLISSYKGKVRCELSLPMTCNGKVDGWKERIILRDIDIDPEASVTALPLLPDQPDIDVPLTRRSA